MDTSFFNNPAFASIPEDKKIFLQNFASMNLANNPNELAKQLSETAQDAKNQGLQFNELETNLLISILKETMTEEEKLKTDRIVNLIKTMRPH